MSQTTVGLVGLGRMGQAVAPRLLEAKFNLAVWNRTASRCEEFRLKGAATPATLEDLAARSAIILVFANADGTRDVLTGAGGLLEGLRCPTVVALMGTFAPQEAIDLAARVTATGATCLDIPVLGTVGPARAGQLVALAGGEKSAVQLMMPVLQTLCRRTVHVGPVGSASALKLGHNLILTNYWRLIAETMAVAEGFGVARNTILDVLSDSPAGLPALRLKTPILLGTDSEVGFDVDAVHDEMELIARACRSLNLRLPLTESAVEILNHMKIDDWGDRDVASMALYLLSSINLRQSSAP